MLVTKHIFNSEFVCHGNRRFGLLKGVYTQYHGTEDDLEGPMGDLGFTKRCEYE